MSAESPLTWTPDGQPRSRLYGDVYFSAEDGLAETRAVFLEGCGMPGAWQGRSAFCVGELGFGTGLNILALLDLWRRTSAPGAHLHIFSIEAHPITAAEADRALAHWPELKDLADLLAARWPGQAKGFHRVDFPEARATLDLAVMDVESALAAWSGWADAWFLDGFSPALNPDMWREEIMALVAARSAPGARAATFTVAGAVRRGLAAAGFEVEKMPGFGRKRQRLEARLAGATPTDRPMPRVAVIGAGIAGASAARALRALGCEPAVLDAGGAGSGASGNPAALVTPRLDAGLGPVAQLGAQAFARAVDLYRAEPASIISSGVIQLTASEKDEARFAKIAASDIFEPRALEPLDAGQATARLGEAAPSALDLIPALVIEPQAILPRWAGPITSAKVAAINREDDAWALRDLGGELIATVDAVVLAAGPASAALWPPLELGAVRGQASWIKGVSIAQAVAWGGYAIPTRDGVLFGATHDRDDTGDEVREADHVRNRATLAAALPGLAGKLAAAPLEGRASVRATTTDRLPTAGAAENAPGLYLLTGFGSRGFSLAPLLAEHVAALVLGAPSPLPGAVAEVVVPARFRLRAERRGRTVTLDENQKP
ncbi:tRNA (5-methylaminomethyl-2-thiouridine)(34)-methyltransferase MnmD [Phenylobacterium sp.]|uniref:tRNA (5-methylaminomethyl-2-thiouridine)(34)-methyltransferase MnmD n=1 Tax=Phenylobacterium sp. TaxID=1871053 RepID=UPI002730FC63|nr:tRNA (5-methylaminomethyl-2-thiouridine)(34)-methyltransferase MnmD [Phenylobacterium sp.]MDP1597976.1 tRNA (5-methylaminomethyl-2-thiouridine)(34)-methyltransferase MnmD [Phenylobacterium sp.]